VTAKTVFWSLVIGAAVALSAAWGLLGDPALAGLSAGLGIVWLAVDARISSQPGTLFFLAFVGLIIAAVLNDALILLALPAMCAALGAWDLSRFRARLADQPVRERQAIERVHVRLVTVALCAGFAIALLPVLVHISLSFVLVCGVTLLAVLALRQAVGARGAGRDSA